MVTIRRLICAWILTLAGSLVLPLVSVAAVSNTTYDTPHTTTTTTAAATITEQTAAVHAVGGAETSLRGMRSGQVRALLLLSRSFLAPKNTLRAQYEAEVRGLSDYADEFLAKGASDEPVARLMNTARRQLGVKYKDMTPLDLLDYIHRYNLHRYGDRLGPTYDFMRNVQGKTPAQIIRSASHPGDFRQLGTALHRHFGEEIVPILKKYVMLR